MQKDPQLGVKPRTFLLQGNSAANCSTIQLVALLLSTSATVAAFSLKWRELSEDAGSCRSTRPDPAKQFSPGQDGLHDAVCSRNGCRCHTWYFLLSQDQHAGQGADGRSWENHDPKRGTFMAIGMGIRC
ncbi:hypothetical protein ILYODFUR_032978 [Ilyodon furcidens]|uniref:Uncharacterized protein n=1 Tax=Ilyodon furcidens TaxID=33524 RepID=A0ABV0T2H4_9TELE